MTPPPPSAFGPGAVAPPGPPPVMYHQRPATKQVPGIGAGVAALGLLLLFFASTSMNWIDIDNAGDQGKMDLSEINDWLEHTDDFPVMGWYADWGWLLVCAYVAAVAVFATLLNPRDKGARSAIWAILYIPFPFAPIMGAGLGFINLADEEGKIAPRILGASAMITPAFPLFLVWIDLLNDYNIELRGEDIGMGLWMSFVGLAVVMIGCGLGTRTVPATPNTVGPMGMGQPPMGPSMGGPPMGPGPMGHPPVHGPGPM